jgi:hypothetical protein
MATLADMGQPFMHGVPLAVRDYMRQAFKGALQRYDRLALPLAGLLQMAECAVDAGWRVGELQCADTNLWSAVLGYHCAGKDIEELGIAWNGDDAESQWARDKFASGNHVAAVGLYLKLLSLRHAYTAERLVRAELWRERDRYGNQFQANAMRLSEKLRGIDFQVKDVFTMVDDVREDDSAVIYIDPPRLFGEPFGCVGKSLNWTMGVLAPFEAKTGMAKLHHDLMTANALAFFHWHAKTIPTEYVERAVYVVERNAQTREHVLANRPDEARQLVKPRNETEIEAVQAPVCPPGMVLTRDMSVDVRAIERAQGLYYADLWGRNLPRRLGQCYHIMVSGHILAVAGMTFTDIRQSRGPWVTQTFLACAPGVPRGSILAQMALTCESARKLFEKHADAPLYDVKEFRRVVQEDFPCCPVLAACGLELKTRERQESGCFVLTYQGPFRRKWFDEIAKETLDFVDEIVDNLQDDSGAINERTQGDSHRHLRPDRRRHRPLAAPSGSPSPRGAQAARARTCRTPHHHGFRSGRNRARLGGQLIRGACMRNALGLVGLLWVTLYVAAAYGWIINLVQVFKHLGDPTVTPLFVARCFGIVAAPLGAILGFVG